MCMCCVKHVGRSKPSEKCTTFKGSRQHVPLLLSVVVAVAVLLCAGGHIVKVLQEDPLQGETSQMRENHELRKGFCEIPEGGNIGLL